MAGKKKPKILSKFRFVNDLDTIESSGLDEVRGQGSLVLSTLQNDPDQDWDSRMVACAVERHPEFRTRMTPQTAGQGWDGFSPAQRVTNYWLWRFKKLGLIRKIENAD